MKVLFIYPDFLTHRQDWPGYFYSGIAQLSAVLKVQGHQTRLIHIVKLVKNETYISQVREFDPQLICFSGASNYAGVIARLSKTFADAGIDTPKIIGGIHATVCPEECMRMEGIDIVCRGEGEAPLVELCDHIEKNEDIFSIKNLWLKKDGKILKNPLRTPIENLDALPFPDRAVFPGYTKLYLEREGLISMMASRGCPYNCAYCSNKILREITDTKKIGVRFRSPRHVIDEIHQVRDAYPFLNKVTFDDDILFFNKSWAEEFVALYAKEVSLPFICNGRANLLREDTIKLLKKAGCYHLKIGLESGNEHISNHILNRNISNDQIREAFRLARENGLRTETFNMVGLPDETPANVLDTIKLNAEMKTNGMQVTIFQPFPGTDLYEYCREKGYISEAGEIVNFFQGTSVRQQCITPSQVRMFRDYFKIFVASYKVVNKAGKLRNPTIRFLDFVFCANITSRIFNAAYKPLNFLFRKMQSRKYKKN